ncbi:hypothetical protein HK405_009357, partial [Cladochytrium tenue]
MDGLGPLAILGLIAVASVGFLAWRSFTGTSSSNVPPNSRPAQATAPKAGASTAANSALLAANGKKSIGATFRSIANPKKLILFYGSQTGTAEDLASRLAREANAHLGVHTVIADVEDYDMSELLQLPAQEDLPEGEKWLVGFFLATYGEGEPTDSAVEFYDWLMDGNCKGDDDNAEFEDDMVSDAAGKNINYVMFGLGNKTYDHFNSMSRRVKRRLNNIGATLVGEAGEGDDDGSMEDDFMEWNPKALKAIAEFFGVVEGGGAQDRDAPHVATFDWVPVAAPAENDVFHGELSSGKPRQFQSNGPDKNFTEIRRILYDIKNPYFGRIAESRQLFNGGQDVFDLADDALPVSSEHYQLSEDGRKISVDRSCVHMELDLTGSSLRYEAGDHLGVFASNSQLEVNALISALGLTDEELDAVCELKPNPSNPLAATAKMPFPNPCSLRTALTHYLAISSPVKQFQLGIMAKFAHDEKDREALFKLMDDRDLFVDIVEESQKTLSEMFTAFPSVKLPLGVLIGEIIPRINVRYYSISSSPKKGPGRVSLTAVIVRYVLPSVHPHHHINGTPHKKPISYHEGLATSWIERLHKARTEISETAAAASPSPLPPLHVPIFIRTSSFRLPRDATAPIVMVGPGTGVAPFRGFLHERMHLAATRPANLKPVGPTWLFFGCRRPNEDDLYRDEFTEMTRTVDGWREAAAAGGAEYAGPQPFDLRLFTAYSRAGPQKVYVQHRLMEAGQELWDVLDKKRGYVYVCGDAKNMAADVQRCLIQLGMQFGNRSEDSAKSWLKDLKSTNRLQED